MTAIRDTAADPYRWGIRAMKAGIIATAIKKDEILEKDSREAIDWMKKLNDQASEVALACNAQAATDITGFGLLGHAAEMLDGSGCGLRLESRNIPILPEAVEYAAMGLMPAGAFKNKAFRIPMVEFASAVESLIRDILFDPQTSGGLLICVDPQQADDLVGDLVKQGVTDADIIGQVVEKPVEKIVVR